MRRSSPTAASQPQCGEPPRLSAIILAGGQSRRMGQDKAWIEWGGKPLIQWAVEKVRDLGVAEIFISGRVGEDYSALQCPVLHDLEPGFGPLGGIERGLRVCNAPLLLVLAVDLPHMTTAFLRKMAARCDRWTGVVPKRKGELEPLAAVYPKRCHSLALAAVARSQRTVRDFVEACRQERAVRCFPVSPVDAGCFANWNNPADVSGQDQSWRPLPSGTVRTKEALRNVGLHRAPHGR